MGLLFVYSIIQQNVNSSATTGISCDGNTCKAISMIKINVLQVYLHYTFLIFNLKLYFALFSKKYLHVHVDTRINGGGLMSRGALNQDFM